MTSARHTTFLLVALVLVSALLTATLLGRPPRGEAGDDVDADLASALASLAAVQHRTAAALERLEDRLATVPVAANGPRREVAGGAPAPESLEDLVRSLDALRTTIERESGETQDLIRSAPAFGGESLVALRDRRAAPDWAELTDLEQAWREDEEAADRSQYLLTPRDLVDRYGPPSAIYRPQGGMLFCYRQHAQGEAGPAWYYRIQDGYVVEFFLEDEGVESDD